MDQYYYPKTDKIFKKLEEVLSNKLYMLKFDDLKSVAICFQNNNFPNTK